MPVINIEVLQDILGGSADVDARITATVNRASIDAYRVSNQFVIFPRDLVIPVVNGLPTQDFILTALPAGYYWHVDIFVNGEAPLRRTVIVPDGNGPFDFEDLIDVVPETALPDTSQDVYQAWLAQIIAAVERSVPAGGTAGQVLAKINGQDYNTHWVDQTGGSGNNSLIKSGNWNYPSQSGVAIQPTEDGESIALKSSRSAALRWHIRDGGPSVASYSPDILSINNELTDGGWVTFNISEQEAALPVGYTYGVSIDTGDQQYAGSYVSVASTTTTITLDYLSGAPDSFDRTGLTGTLALPSVYSQVEAKQDGVWIKNANWSEDPTYSNYWHFKNDGSLELPMVYNSEADIDEAVISASGGLTLRTTSTPGGVIVDSYNGLYVENYNSAGYGVNLNQGKGWISGLSSPNTEQITRTATYSNWTDNSSNGLNNSVAITVPSDGISAWFAQHLGQSNPGATITFADSTQVQTISIYDTTSQSNQGILFQWADGLTKTFEETFPLTITGTANVTTTVTSVGVGSYEANFEFTENGNFKFPVGPSNGRTGTGETLKFGNRSYQSIITGSAPTESHPTANRFVIAGQDGFDGTTGEGGDIYLWAGQGGSGGGTGGDIKVDAGQGSGAGEGGTIKVRGGYSPNGVGGFVEISAGNSYTQAGGDVTITAGASYNGEGTPGGDVNINAGYSSSSWAGGNMTLTTTQEGKITLSGSGGEFLNDSSNPNNQIATIGDVGTKAYIRVNAPASSVGQAGDVATYVADDATYHYYCTGTYDGTTNIWKRVAWSVDTW